MKLLSPGVHGVLDYAMAGIFAVAPVLFMFGHSRTPITLCWIMASTLTATSLLTRYPLGAIRVIPFPVHGMIELASSIFLVAAPWLTGFSDQPIARMFFLSAGMSIFTLWLLTDYQAAERRDAA